MLKSKKVQEQIYRRLIKCEALIYPFGGLEYPKCECIS